jgi:hypothetical protein
MNKVPTERQIAVISALVEAIRATVRTTGVAKNTVTKLLARTSMRRLSGQSPSQASLQTHCDEIWSFCYAKEKNPPNDLRGKFGYGDVWTWTALRAETGINSCGMGW